MAVLIFRRYWMIFKDPIEIRQWVYRLKSFILKFGCNSFKISETAGSMFLQLLEKLRKREFMVFFYDIYFNIHGKLSVILCFT